MKDLVDSDVASDAAPDDCVPPNKRRDPTILPQRRRGAHLVDAQISLERWRAETWTRQYAKRPWSPEILLPSRVVSNIANKTFVQSTEALIEIGGWARHRALVHGEELLCILREVDERERDRRASEKQKKLDERLERKHAAETVREAKKAEAKRRREEERLNRPKKPRLSRAKLTKHVAAGIGLGKENVPPLSAPPVSVMLPTGSWPPMVPFTPSRPTLTSHAGSITSTPRKSAPLPVLSPMMTSLTGLQPTPPMEPFTPPRPTSHAGSMTSMPHQFAPLPAQFTQFTPVPALPAFSSSPGYPAAVGIPTSPSQQSPTSFWATPYPAAGNPMSPASFWTPAYLPPHMTSPNPPDPLQPSEQDSSQYPTAAMNGIQGLQTLVRYHTWPQ